LLLSKETWQLLAEQGVVPMGQGTRLADQAICCCRDMGSRERPREMGTLLYDALRACDSEGADRIFVEACSAEGQGAAVLNRLRKAASDEFMVL
jgi:putative protein kinase ArgK-like GTPase of G3E family